MIMANLLFLATLLFVALQTTLASPPLAIKSSLQCKATVHARYSFLVHRDPKGEATRMESVMILTASITSTKGDELCAVDDAVKRSEKVTEVMCKHGHTSIFLDGPTDKDSLRTMGLQFTKSGQAWMLVADDPIDDLHSELIYKAREPFPCDTLGPKPEWSN